MPKQVYNIQQFHGGLNTGSDPRDVMENELSAMTDVMVDDLGKIRLLGGNATHAAASNPTSDINPGYGLFYFSHDREGANITSGDHTGIHTAGVASFTITAGGSGYSSAPDVGIASNGGSGASATATLSGAGAVNGFTSIVAGSGYTSVPAVSFSGGGGSGAAATAVMEANQAALDDPSATFPVDGVIGATIHNQSDGSSIVITDNTATTVTGTLAGGTGNNWNVGDVYNITFPETGNNYLLLADTDTSGAIAVYNEGTNTWTAGIITLGPTTGMKPTFYVVDGSLRVSDGNFGALNVNKWYGYIDRTLFKNSTSYDIDSWNVESQKISKPASSRFANQLLSSGVSYTTVNNDSVGGSVQNYTVDDDGSLGSSNVSRITISYSAVSTNTEREYLGDFDIIAGGWNGSSFTGTTKTGSGNFYSNDSTETDTGTVVITFDSDPADIDVSTAEAVDPQKVRVQMQNINEHGAGTLKITNVKYDAGSGTPVPHSNLSVENVEVEVEMGVPNQSGARGWGQSSTVQWKWNVGVSFIYDEKQESLITELEDVYTGTQTASSDSTSPDLLTDSAATFITDDLIGETIYNTTDNSFGTILDNDGNTVSATLDEGTDDSWDNGDTYEITKTTVSAISTQAPTIKFSLKYSSSWNTRITGAKLYMRKSQGDEISSWHPQIDYDFIKGKATVRVNGYEQDVEYNGSLDEYSWEIPNEKLQQPNLVGTFQGEAGFKYDEESIISKYKTAVVVNRLVYIGGLEVQKEDNSTEIMGDAMIKTPVNKFDVFPLSKIIEVSVRDGDDIVKLEEYADRILQFKKHKMHLINVSQSIEFLEETFMHKGVSHPAATCKTDFGIAWVNKFGCYLYDGRQVTNLLEKGGRQIIKESDWATFTTNEPMIGYIPKKRQLIVVDDNTATGTGNIFLYDMVTQSWVEGADATLTSADLTNFITDWNGDLVHAHTAGTVLKWDDTSDDSSGVSIITKDIDFGQPSVRKKIYKVYLTFRGDARQVQVHYGVDGLSPALTFNDITSGTDGSSTGSGSNAKCLPYNADVDNWLKAELKPSASINNISSFRLKISGDGSSAIGATFEVNDISVVYRLKSIK